MIENLSALSSDPAAWAALAALVAIEVVLGIDNLIFISVLSNKLPQHQRELAQRVGIGFAVGMRLLLLASITWIMQLTEPVFAVLGRDFSWRDLILIAGGSFLLWKAANEIWHSVAAEPNHGNSTSHGKIVSFTAVIGQIVALDLVFSIDSIITAVGMTDNIAIMIMAILIAVTAMLVVAAPLSNFIGRNPTVVMLALAILLLVGVALIAEGLGLHIPKGYIYSAMGFAAITEALNLLSRRARRTEWAQLEAIAR